MKLLLAFAFFALSLPAHAYKVVAVDKLTSPHAQAVYDAANAIEGGQAYAFKVKYFFPSSTERLDMIYFFNDRVKQAMAASYPAWGDSEGYNIGIGSSQRFETARSGLTSTPFLLSNEPLLDAMIAGLEKGAFNVFWLSRTLLPRGLYAYGVIDYNALEFTFVVVKRNP